MTSKEKEKVAILLGAVRSAISNINWYCRDYDSTELKGVAEDLQDALNEFNKTKSTTKKK